MGLCKLCNKEKKLIKAHIIPEWVTKFIKDEDTRPIKVLSTKEGTYPRKSYTGEYDENILCASCDEKIGQWDDYAKTFFLSDIDKSTIRKFKGEDIGYEIKDFEYEKAKMFCMSLLWRQSVSTRDIFQGVNLGNNYEEHLRRILIGEVSAKDSDFPVVLMRFNYDPKKISMLHPYKVRLNNVLFYKMSILGFRIFVKVSKVDTPSALHSFVLKDNNPLYVILDEYVGSKEHNVMGKIVNYNIKKHGRIF